jgi:hypothetical protein
MNIEKQTTMKKISSTAQMAIALVPIAYAVSYYLLSYYVEGDQFEYRLFYERLYGVGIDEVSELSIAYLGASEPIPAFVLWLGANLGIEKTLYVSLWNVVLIVGIFILARKNNASLPVIFLLLTNFYVLVLVTSAERLKIAYIILIIAMLINDKRRLFLLAISPFAHLQSLILLTSALLSNYADSIRSIFSRLSLAKKSLVMAIAPPVVMALLGYMLLEGVVAKGTYYSGESNSPYELLNIGFFAIIMLYVTNNRLRLIFAIAPLIMAVAVLGSSRVNMIAVTVVFYFLLKEQKLNHPLVVAVLIYFSLKTIPFVHDIVVYNDGFTYSTSLMQVLSF